MQCYVYKGDKKEDHYLFLSQEFDANEPPAELPNAILNLMGDLSLVIDFDLEPTRNLQQADAKQVIADIQSQGFYLQMPKQDMAALEDQYFN